MDIKARSHSYIVDRNNKIKTINVHTTNLNEKWLKKKHTHTHINKNVKKLKEAIINKKKYTPFFLFSLWSSQ